MSKEEIYDTQISPLMAQIIAICKEHKIPFLADFYLDQESGLKCSTFVFDDYETVPECYKEASQILKPQQARKPLMVTTRNEKGEVISMEAIL